MKTKNSQWHLINICRGCCGIKYEFKFTEDNEKAIINRLQTKK